MEAFRPTAAALQVTMQTSQNSKAAVAQLRLALVDSFHRCEQSSKRHGHRENCQAPTQSRSSRVGLERSYRQSKTNQILQKFMSVCCGCPKNYSMIKEALSEILLILKNQRRTLSLNAANFSSTKRHLWHSVLMALSTAMCAAGPSEPCEDTWWMGPTTPFHSTFSHSKLWICHTVWRQF